MSRIVWNERATAAANAARELPRMMSGYFSQVRRALDAKPSPASLHRVRLASKKVRYTLELFQPCYGAGFKQRMEALKSVQTSLGEVNDAVAASRLIEASMPPSPERKALRSHLKRRAAEKAGEFRLHWIERFDAPGREAWWTGFLAKPRNTRPRRLTTSRMGVS